MLVLFNTKVYTKILLTNFYSYIHNLHTFYFFLLNVIYSGNLKILFFFRKRFKKFFKLKNIKYLKFKRIKKRSLLNFSLKRNRIKSVYISNYILFIKRKTGLFKTRYDKKKYNLYRMSYLLDLKKNKKRKSKFVPAQTLRKKSMSKFFFMTLRNTLSNNVDQKLLRQNKKSKVFSKMFNINTNKITYFDELVVWKILVKNRVFINKRYAIEYISKIGVFINGEYTKNCYIMLNVGDVIQLPYNIRYTKYLIKFFKRYRKYFRLIKNRVFKLIRHKINPNKQSTKNIPRWISKFENYHSAKSINLESDYLMSTFIIVYKPKNYTNTSFYKKYFSTSYLNRLYNWKYII